MFRPGTVARPPPPAPGGMDGGCTGLDGGRAQTKDAGRSGRPGAVPRSVGHHVPLPNLQRTPIVFDVPHRCRVNVHQRIMEVDGMAQKG